MSQYPDHNPFDAHAQGHGYNPYNNANNNNGHPSSPPPQHHHQHGYDGYDGYSDQNAYNDPFHTPSAPPPMPMGHYPGPAYGASPTPHPMSPPPGAPLYPPQSPPPNVNAGLGYGTTRPDTAYSHASRYSIHDNGPGLDDPTDSDMPLLRHDAGGANSIPTNFDDDNASFVGGFQSGAPAMPGNYSTDPTESNIRYGRIPQRVPRRFKTIKKKVELFHGNFVLDSAVPTKLLALCAQKTDREFTHMRYSAATSDPNDFGKDGFTLRQLHYDPPRRTELFIVMTMYNEDDTLFTRTMHGVMKNVAHLCSRDRSKTWGKEGWKKVVVCVVSDGRAKVNSRTLSVLAAMGAYQEGIAKNVIDNKPVTAHIYEYTTQVSITPSLKLETSASDSSIVPVQVIFCLKEKNAKKINSHRWFFNAFGQLLQPNVCILLDVGTRPGPTSIYHLWKAFDINSNVGGACGEIVADKGKWGRLLLNPLVAAQNFEYKISNILDKPLESLFGYITVLPGAFSAYRYIALQNHPVTGEGPLKQYFLGETMHGAAGGNIFVSNMYLAEDRILCWELVSKRGASWVLHYVKSAYAVTDVPDQVPELISQRRRWLNGSFFAGLHGTVHFYYIYRSSHTFLRKFWIHVELVYQTFNLIFSWFALANYYIAFVILTQSLEDPLFNLKGINIANNILEYFYLGLLILCFILSLGNRPQGSKWGYTMAFIGFGFITIYMTIAAFWLAYKGVDQIVKENAGNKGINVMDLFGNSIFRNIVLSLLATLGLYVLASLIFFEPWHMITSFLQYLLMAPSYIAVLNVYAFANVHDVSWGTKGDNKAPAADLGVVKSEGKKGEVEVDVPTAEKDINAAYEDAIHVLQTKPPPAPDPGSGDQEDYYKSIRTNVLLAWTLSNGLLGAVIVSATGKPTTEGGAQNTVKGYMAFLLFSVVGLAFVRFVGSAGYMVVRLFAGE